MSNEQTISAAQLIAEIERAAMEREEARWRLAVGRDGALAALRQARDTHMRLVAELAGLPAREER